MHFFGPSPGISNLLALSVLILWIAPSAGAQPAAYPGVPKIDGSSCAWATGFEGQGPDARVRAMAVFDDGTGPALYVGGFRMTTSGDKVVNSIAQWDGSEWSALGSGVTLSSSSAGEVYALTVFDDGTGPALYVGGDFSQAGGIEADNIAKWDGNQWSALDAGIDDFGADVYALAVFDDGNGPALYAAGEFETIGGITVNHIARWDGSSWSALGSGMGGTSFPEVQALAVYDDGSGPSLYAGGEFTTAGGKPASYIAKWDGDDWSALGLGLGGSSPEVRALAVHNDGSGQALYVGGEFSTADGKTITEGIARWRGQGWSGVGTEFDDHVYALLSLNDGKGSSLYATGSFFVSANERLERIAKWDGNEWQSLGTGLEGLGYALAGYNDGNGEALYVGGWFQQAGNTVADNIAKWQDSSWSVVGSSDGDGLGDVVRALAVHDDGTGSALYAAGDFIRAGDTEASSIAKWTEKGWDPLGEGLSDDARALATYDDGSGSALYVGGDFSFAGGMASRGIARWDGSQWSPVGSGLNGDVTALEVFDDGSGSALYAAVIGEDDFLGGGGSSRVQRWDGTDWSEVGDFPSLGGGGNEEIFAFQGFDDGQNGSLLFAGGSLRQDGIAKWDGFMWSGVGNGISRREGVYALAVFDDGSGPALYAGGSFSEDRDDFEHLAKWDGVSWTQVDLGVSSDVRALSVYDDGNGPALYLGGDFRDAGDVDDVNRVVRWDGTTWTPLDLGMNEKVYALTVFDDGTGPSLYAGGEFTVAGGIVSSRMARWKCPDAPSANLAVTLDNGTDQIITGQPTVYTLVVSNPTTVDVPAAKVEAELPSPLKCSWTSEASSGVIGHTGGQGSFLENQLVMPRGSTVTYTVECAVDPESEGEVTATTTVTTTYFESDLSDNVDSDTDPIFRLVDLELDMTSDTDPVLAGGEIQYTLTLSSVGATAVADADIANEFADVLDCQWLAVASGGATGHTHSGTGSILEGGLHLPPGSSIVYEVSCEISADAGGELVNTATATAPEDTHPENDVATLVGTIEQGADVELTFTNGTDVVLAGGTVVYGLAVVNHGPSNAPATLLEVHLPGSECGWRSVGDGSATGTSIGFGMEIDDVLNLPVGSSARYVISCAVPLGAGEAIEAEADAILDIDPTANRATDSDTVSNRFDRETLILTHFGRMLTEMDLMFVDFEELLETLHDFAGHPRVNGLLLDLGHASDLGTSYAEWDGDSQVVGAHPEWANRVLFGCAVGDCNTERQGLRDLLREQRQEQSKLGYLQVIGDDRIVPMARIPDFTGFPSEDAYVGNGSLAGLSAQSTVGQALARDFYLSDDPIGIRRPIDDDDLGSIRQPFLPDLGVGRLVETPQEIIGSIDGFLVHGGLIDLRDLDPDHRVLISGYDFLIDSATKIRRRWNAVYGIEDDPEELVPVDGLLIGRTWRSPTATERVAMLLDHLSGRGTVPYRLMSLNGHATHYEEGVPGESLFDIRGLPSEDLSSLDLEGTLIYAVGCHGGLPVPGRDAPAEDRPLDLPQAFLERGALAYLANTGFGWGLLNAVGYSERLVDLFTRELSIPDPLTVYEAVRRAKTRYFSEDPYLDPYDVKTSLQWALYGFPMVEVRTGIESSALSASGTGRQGEPVPCEGVNDLPAHMACQELTTTFAADGPYKKYWSTGEEVPGDELGCPPDPEGVSVGCYYNLFGLQSAEGDLPIEPTFIQKTQVEGTSLHGVLWMGADYETEPDWSPVYAQLVSNDGPLDLPGSLPQVTFIRPRFNNPDGGSLTEATVCTETDLEPSTLVYTPAELLYGETGELNLHRIHQRFELELFYYNNQDDGSGNCDRTGPQIDNSHGPLHEIDAGVLRWSVAASDGFGGDQNGVWRVVVVWDDQDAESWTAQELTYDSATQRWLGELSLPQGEDELVYFLQAVDHRGNVSWVDYQRPTPSESGIVPDLPLPLSAVLPPMDPIFADGFESGDCSAWSGCP